MPKNEQRRPKKNVGNGTHLQLIERHLSKIEYRIDSLNIQPFQLGNQSLNELSEKPNVVSQKIRMT